MITLEPLRRDQYRQVAEWEHGPQPEETDWERHTQEMEEPNRLNYAVYADDQFCGAICYEKVSPTVVGVHVSKEPHTITPNELARLLIQVAGYLFQNGVEELQAVVHHRPARRLAIRTGMTYRSNSKQGERYAITKEEYYKIHVEP